MFKHLHSELRKEFQIERMIFFSDAVFAIAITLLIIEIKVPVIHEPHITDNILLHELKILLPKLFGFLLSFALIANYWVSHHRMFSYINNYDGGLIWINMVFLLAVVIMPFSTAFYSEYALSKAFIPALFYTGNLLLLSLLNYFMWVYISNPRRKLTENLSASLIKLFKRRAISVPIIFLLFIIVYYFSPLVAIWIPPLIPVILRILFFRPDKNKFKKDIRTEL